MVWLVEMRFQSTDELSALLTVNINYNDHSICTFVERSNAGISQLTCMKTEHEYSFNVLCIHTRKAVTRDHRKRMTFQDVINCWHWEAGRTRDKLFSTSSWVTEATTNESEEYLTLPYDIMLYLKYCKLESYLVTVAHFKTEVSRCL